MASVVARHLIHTNPFHMAIVVEGIAANGFAFGAMVYPLCRVVHSIKNRAVFLSGIIIIGDNQKYPYSPLSRDRENLF